MNPPVYIPDFVIVDKKKKAKEKKERETVIRVFEKIDDTPAHILHKFRNALQAMGCWKEEMGGKFDHARWIVSDNGIQWENDYLDYPDPVPSKFGGLPVRANAHPDLLNTHTRPFEGGINFALYPQFINQGNKFDFNSFSIIHQIALLLFNEFKTRPVIFLVDESKKQFPPGDTWEPVELSVYKSMRNPWNFDYAILPRSLDKIYETVAITHSVKIHENYIEAWRINKWKKEVFIHSK